MDNQTITLEHVCEINKESGFIEITEIDTESGDVNQFILKHGLDDVSDWIRRNGTEGHDYHYKKQWYDCEGGNGWYESVFSLDYNELDSNIIEYSLTQRDQWERIEL